MVRVHITADSECWTGDSTLALHAAKCSGPDSVVITAGNADMVRRIEAAGVTAVRCPMGGMFASLNLSRALRRLQGDEFRVYVHSQKVKSAVESALKLVGRREPMSLGEPDVVTSLPAVEVERPAEGAEPLLMWLGNITADCGLRELIEELGRQASKSWRLRVVGQGKAKVVSPVLKRTKALGIADRIEWTGYSSNPYEQMRGVSVGIVTNPKGLESVAAMEFAAASVPVITNLSELL